MNTESTAKPNITGKSEFVTLIILDGLGVHPDPLGNAVIQAKTPFLDTIWTKGRSTLLHASGVHVGLPELESGNSEVGHLNIGAGRIVAQSLPRINDDIKTGRLQKNSAILKAMNECKRRKTQFHIMGILSDGGVHGHINHLIAILEICAANDIDPALHLFTDGRDTQMYRGVSFIKQIQETLQTLKIGRIASICGRFYAMDRDKRWERTQLAYDALIGKSQNSASDCIAGVEAQYKEGLNDQIIMPFQMVNDDNEAVAPIQENDVIFFYNFREDRARQLTKAFVLEKDVYIEKETHFQNLYFLTMTGYEDKLPVHVVYPPSAIDDSLSSIISKSGFKQLHISETEKFMHITYFLNGGVEKAHEGEDFFNIPSPHVFDYSEAPEMSAEIIKDEVLYRLNKYDQFQYKLIAINFANPDMLGHTGKIDETAKSIEIVDRCVKEIVMKVAELGGSSIIIADHGNCETMIDRMTGEIHTYHTNNPIPFIFVENSSQCSLNPGEKGKKIGRDRDLTVSGMLADVAPTALSVLGIDIPKKMTGINLLEVI